jgi:hypothetical protein
MLAPVSASATESTDILVFTKRFGLAYLHIIEPRVKGGQTLPAGHPPVAAAGLRKNLEGTGHRCRRF